MAEEGINREVLWLLLDTVSFLLANFHAFGLVVEEFEENTSKSFNFVDCSIGIDSGVLRYVNIFSILHSTVKLCSAAGRRDVHGRERSARLAEHTRTTGKEAAGAG